MTQGHEGFREVLHSPADWGLEPPPAYAVLETWAVPTGNGPEEENRPVVIPLDPGVATELHQRLRSSPDVALPWSMESSTEQFDLATFGGEQVIVHRPPGVLTIKAGEVICEIDGKVPGLTVESGTLDQAPTQES